MFVDERFREFWFEAYAGYSPDFERKTSQSSEFRLRARELGLAASGWGLGFPGIFLRFGHQTSSKLNSGLK